MRIELDGNRDWRCRVVHDVLLKRGFAGGAVPGKYPLLLIGLWNRS